jgi:hypothetical protein
MNLKISAIELKNNFIDSFKNEKSFNCDDGNPFLITFERKEYYVFLKNISPAYYMKYPDITRIQLPYSPHFSKISKSIIPFIILGFNAEYGTFTGWDPSKIKSRLNNKSNVSLFSRDSFQEKLRLDDFKEHQISNGDEVILFSIRSTPIYFKSVKSLFKNNQTEQNINKVKKNKGKIEINSQSEKVEEHIQIPEVLKEINSFKKKNDLIGAVLFCHAKFQKDMPDFEIEDWTQILSKKFYPN